MFVKFCTPKSKQIPALEEPSSLSWNFYGKKVMQSLLMRMWKVRQLDNLDLEIRKEQELYLMCISTSEQRLMCVNNSNLQSEGLESKNKMFFFWN